jgi:hypothetical protein
MRQVREAVRPRDVAEWAFSQVLIEHEEEKC